MKSFFSVVGVALVALLLFFAFSSNNELPSNNNYELAISEDDTEMIQVAKQMIGTLDADQKKLALIDFDDDERTHWNYVPMDRKGFRYRDMSDAQKKLTKSLLRTGLSDDGFKKAENIMALEEVLGILENNGGPNARRDPEKYWLAIFGEPSAVKPWGWRFEGHHLSLNFTSYDNQIIAYTPIFMGSNPGEVPSGPKKGLRVLKDEEDMGRAFLKSLSAEQQKKAVIAKDAPDEVITGNDRKVSLTTNEGLSVNDMNPSQQKALKEILNVYFNKMKPEIAKEQWKKVNEAGFEKLVFAWAGKYERKQRHYYRIQGPTLLIEYDNTQSNANHVHTIIRDIDNDFGEDLLHKHYQTSDHH